MIVATATIITVAAITIMVTGITATTTTITMAVITAGITGTITTTVDRAFTSASDHSRS